MFHKNSKALNMVDLDSALLNSNTDASLLNANHSTVLNADHLVQVKLARIKMSFKVFKGDPRTKMPSRDLR